MSALGGEDCALECRACPVRSAGLCAILSDHGYLANPLEGGGLARTYRAARPRSVLMRTGEPMGCFAVLCDGWAFQFLRLADGRRQILSLILPSDPFCASTLFSPLAPVSVEAMTQVRYALFPAEGVREAAFRDRAMLRGLADCCKREMGEKNRLLLDLGRRSAEERIAHLILNVTDRLEARSDPRGERFDWPLRQQHVADITGLTTVHVSRVMGDLRKAGIVDVSRNEITILDNDALTSIGASR